MTRYLCETNLGPVTLQQDETGAYTVKRLGQVIHRTAWLENALAFLKQHKGGKLKPMNPSS